MTQQMNNGMRLRQTSGGKKQDRAWLLNLLVAWLSSIAGLLSFAGITGNGSDIVLTVMLAVSLIICMIYGILAGKKLESWRYLAVPVLLLLMLLCVRNQLLEGFRIFWNRASDAMVRGTGWVIPEWQLQLPEKQQGISLGLFAGLVSGLFSFVCCVLTGIAPVLLAIFMPAGTLLGMALFGMDQLFIWLLPVLLVCVLILVYSGWRDRNAGAPVVLSWAICALTAGVLLAFASLPGLQSWAENVRDDVHERIHEEKYETRYTTLPEGDFTDFLANDKESVQALAVTMEVPQQLYLRGYTGAVFTGTGWEPLDQEALVKNKQLLYWLNLNTFDLNAQFDAAASYAGLEKSTVTVQNIGACSFYRYVPFTIGKGAWSEPENLNSDGVRGEGERNYVYSVVSGSGEDILKVLNQLQTSEDPSVLQYRRAESGYRQFIYHYYLQVPQEAKDLLAKYWDPIAAKYGSAQNLTLQQAQECALIFLSQCFPEEGTPEDMELPLEMAEGTTFQYATVAALTMRYFGIPARYAEGYVISEEMAAAAEPGDTLTVDSSCAKAWVEVYQDGIGWIPMDLTPGMGEMLENAVGRGDGTGEGSSATSKDPEKDEEEEEDPDEDDEEQPEPDGGTQVKLLMQKLLKILLIALAVLLLIFLILWIRRKVLLGRKEKQFRHENVREGIAWIYADTAVLLEQLGFARGNGSMRSLTDRLQETYGEEFASAFTSASDLNDRAMFSSRPLSEEDREAVMEFRSRMLETLQAERKWYRKLWLKWVRCLY